MSDKTPVTVVDIDFGFKANFDLDAFTIAVTPPEDVEAQVSKRSLGNQPPWEQHLLSWGWWVGLSPVKGKAPARPYAIGPYGDWTWLEDDERLMPLLAPFAEPASRIVFTVAHPRLGIPGNPSFDFEAGPFDVWEFDGTRVTRRPVEKIVEYE